MTREYVERLEKLEEFCKTPPYYTRRAELEREGAEGQEAGFGRQETEDRKEKAQRHKAIVYLSLVSKYQSHFKTGQKYLL